MHQCIVAVLCLKEHPKIYNVTLAAMPNAIMKFKVSKFLFDSSQAFV